MNLGQWIIEEREYEGWKLLAPTTFWNATENEIDEKTGGCGPGGWGDLLVPDTAYGESLFIACRIHDWMYGEGNTLAEKEYADRIFDWNMKVLIQKTPYTHETEEELLDHLRLKRALKYFEAVYYFGHDAFNSGKTLNKEQLQHI